MHLQENGFNVEVVNRNAAALDADKARLGVPAALYSCHTAEVDGYVIEGHVPASSIKRLLEEKPAGVAGLGVGGMPAGSPGMEVPGFRQNFDVVAWDSAGALRVYESH